MASFECPKCHAAIMAPSSLAGESADCPKCGAAIPYWPPSLEDDKPLKKSKRAKKPDDTARKTLIYIATGIGVAFCLILLATFLVLFVRKMKDDAIVKATSEPTRTASNPKEERIETEAPEIQLADCRKISAAFIDNPQRASKEYANKRWRLRVRIDEFLGFNTVEVVVFSGQVANATIRMRSNREVEKLNRSKVNIIEARIIDFQWGYATATGVKFDDGVFVSADVFIKDAR
jgi:DNA-directed RNA polymerase subunit M/transcription elongation factor TFIIS